MTYLQVLTEEKDVEEKEGGREGGREGGDQEEVATGKGTLDLGTKETLKLYKKASQSNEVRQTHELQEYCSRKLILDRHEECVSGGEALRM